MTQEQDNGYRIQPDKFIPDPNNPFANDLMGRKEQADMLVQLATSVSGPAVIAVDAPYGVGKSTFLRMAASTLKLQDAADVIEHNAWETEFSDMPFNSLANMVMAAAQSPDAKELLKENANLFTKHSISIFWKMMPFLATGIAGIPPEATLATTGVSASVVHIITKAVAEFKNLRQLGGGQKRIVIIIDELDRCTPGYAIKTLEAIHHVFDSDGITFVLGLHRQQLMKSINAIYGQGFDSEGYLDRFIDLTIPLSASREDFIKAKLAQRIIVNEMPYRSDFAQQLLMAAPNINARSIDRFAKNLIAVTSVMPSHIVRNAFAFESAYAAACAALAVKIQSPSTYRDFNENRASDKDVYNLLGANQLPLERATAMVATTLIMAQVDISLAASSLSENERHQQINTILAGIQSFGAQRPSPDLNEDTLNKATTILKTHSPLCEQFSSIPELIMKWLGYQNRPNHPTIDPYDPGQRLSFWQEATNIIDLTT